MLTARPRIIIADDHTLMAELCKDLLDTNFDVIAIVNNGRALLKAAAELKPDVIIADIAMPVLNGLDASQRVKEMLPAVKLIFLTMNSDRELAAEAFRRGASAYLLKTCAASEMVTAVHNVLRGKPYVSRALSRYRTSSLGRTHPLPEDGNGRLTPRQREVLQLLAEGKVMKEIAGILNMSARTVAFHKYRIMEALGATTSADLVKYAMQHHMIAP